MKWTILILGRPQPKQRPRVGRRGARYQVYTPAETAAYEEMVGWQARAQYPGPPLEGPLAVSITVYLRPSRRVGDLDNYTKAILDGCDGVLWADDGQIVELHARRVIDHQERVEERVELQVWAAADKEAV